MPQGLGSFSSGPGILEIFEEQWGNHARQELVSNTSGDRAELPDTKHHMYNQMQLRQKKTSSQSEESHSAGGPLG